MHDRIVLMNDNPQDENKKKCLVFKIVKMCLSNNCPNYTF